MIFVPSTRDDISRYYRNTYVKFPETGEKLHYIREVGRESVLGSDEDGNDFELFLNENFPYAVDYILPQKGYFQYNKNAYLLFRIPAKQYQRGLSENNTRVNYLTKSGESKQVTFDFPVLKAYVQKQTYPTFEAAMSNKGGFASIALSQRFAVCPYARLLFIDGVACAQISVAQKEVSPTLPILKPEIEEIVRQSNYKVK